DVKLSDWKRNGDATTKPSFDKHPNSWRSESKGNVFGRETIKDRPVDHHKHHSEFERRHNAGVTHEQQAYTHDFSARRIPDYERKGELGRADSAPKHTGPWLRGKQ